MKLIGLSSKNSNTVSNYAMVDDEDYEWLNQWKWQIQKTKNVVYAVRNEYYKKDGKKKSRRISMHRLILSTPNGYMSDHKNGNGLDNQRENLRIATRGENAVNDNNRRIKSKYSEYKGIRKNYNRWVARVTKDGKRYSKSYTTKEEAAKGYNEMASKLYGEFVRKNKI